MTAEKLGSTLSNVTDSERTDHGCKDGSTNLGKLEVYQGNDDGDPVEDIAQHGANLFTSTRHQRQNVVHAVNMISPEALLLHPNIPLNTSHPLFLDEQHSRYHTFPRTSNDPAPEPESSSPPRRRWKAYSSNSWMARANRPDPMRSRRFVITTRNTVRAVKEKVWVIRLCS